MAIEIRARYGWDGETGGGGSPVAVTFEGGRILRRTVGAPLGGPAAERILDFGEATLLPGLVDMHTHLGINHRRGDIVGQMRDAPVPHILAGSANLTDDLRSGVTTAKLNGDRELFDVQFRQSVRDGGAEAPRLVVSGRGIKSSRCTGGVVATRIADEPAAVAECVRENLAAGVDWIKLFASGRIFGELAEVLQPYYGAPQIAVAAELAHAAGKRISVHCFGGEAADACLSAGVDAIDHGWLLTDRQLERMAARGTRLCPTLGVLTHPEGVLAHLVGGPARDAAQRRIDEIRATVGRALAAEVPLVVGTDGMHGELAYELALLQDLGGRPADLLRAATGGAAALLGSAEEIATLRPGARADLVVVAGDATADLGCLSKPLLVVKDGRIIRHAGASPAYRTN
ncbi:MAG: amidohydrolase family protein [Candidatus Methylomirabilota bacterium]